MKKIIPLVMCTMLTGCSAYLYLIGFENQKVITGQIINIEKFNITEPEMTFLNSINNKKSYNLILPFTTTYPSPNRVIVSKDASEDLFISTPIEMYNTYILSTSGLTKTTDVMSLSKDVSDNCLHNMKDCISTTYEGELIPMENVVAPYSTPYKHGEAYQFEKYVFDKNNVTIILAREMNRNDAAEEKLVPSIKGMPDSEKLLHIAVIKTQESAFVDLLEKKYKGYLGVGFFTGNKENDYSYKDFEENNEGDICKTLSSCMFNVYLNSSISPKFKSDVVDSLYDVTVENANKMVGANADITLDGLVGFVSSGAAQKKNNFDIKVKLVPKYSSLTSESGTTIKTKIGLCITYNVKQVLFSNKETNCEYKNITAIIPQNSSSSNTISVNFNKVITNFGLNIGGLDAMNVSISDMKLVSEPIFISADDKFPFDSNIKSITDGF